MIINPRPWYIVYVYKPDIYEIMTDIEEWNQFKCIKFESNFYFIKFERSENIFMV
jgi:hypothetical protein